MEVIRVACNTRVTGDEMQGTMGRRKTRGMLSTPRLPLRPRDVWVGDWVGGFLV